MKFLDLFGQVFSFVAPSPAAPTALPKVMPSTDLGRVFIRAEYLLKKNGWIQGRGLGTKGELCVGHALHLAAIHVNPKCSHLLSHSAWRTFEQHVKCHTVAEWNDGVFTTKRKVLSVLKELAQSN